MNKPKYCSVLLTDTCVLKCKMCEMWKSTRNPQELTCEEWKLVLMRLRDVLDPQAEICFTGGEPLVKTGIMELIRFAAELGFKTGLNTNGYLIDEPMARAISVSSLWSITLSLDGMNEHTHDLIRGTPGSHRRVMKAIEHLSAFCKELYIGIGTVILDTNLDEIVDLVLWVESNPRISSIRFQAVMQPLATPKDSAWHKNDHYNVLWPKDTGKVHRILDTLIALKEKKEACKLSNPVAQLEIFRDYFCNPADVVKARGCVFSERVININQAGQLHLCPRMQPIGNAKTDDMRLLWGSEGIKRTREAMASCTADCDSTVNCFWE